MRALQCNEGGAVPGFELQAVVAGMRASCNLGREMHGLNYGDGLVPAFVFAGGEGVWAPKKRGTTYPLVAFNPAFLKRITQRYREHPGAEFDVSATFDAQRVGGYFGFHTRRGQRG